MSRKLLAIGFIVASLLMAACGGKAPQGAQTKEPVRKAPVQTKAPEEIKPAAPAQVVSIPPPAGAESALAEPSSAATQSPDATGLPAGATGPGVDPKTGQKYLYKTDTYMVLSENPTVIQAISKNPTPEELEAWRKERESVPLVTEVMTEEELRAFLSRTSMVLPKKETFQEPRMICKYSIPGKIAYMDNISDLTGSGNSIVIMGAHEDSDKTLYFIDIKGNVQKSIIIPHTKMFQGKYFNTISLSKGGYGAVVVKDIENRSADEFDSQPEKVTVIYYDEFGDEKWNKPIIFPQFGSTEISANGKTIALSEGNTRWNEESWLDADLNISKLHIYNSKGEETLTYTGYRNIQDGVLSGNGKYYVGLFWWQDDFEKWPRMIMINTESGKIVWDKPIVSDDDSAWEGYLNISYSGEYISYVSIIREQDNNSKRQSEILVFDKGGKVRHRTRGEEVQWISDDRYFSIENSDPHEFVLACIGEKRVLKIITGNAANIKYGLNANIYINRPNIPGATCRQNLYLITGEHLWDKDEVCISAFSMDGKYIIFANWIGDNAIFSYYKIK